MPKLRVAVANGNWSNPAIWNGGTLPGLTDYVASNTFTVTIDQNIDVGRLSSGAEVNIGDTVFMTSNTAPAGYVVQASSAQIANPAYFAFDNNESTAWFSLVAPSASPQWISYEFPSPIVIDRYSWRTGNSTAQRPNNWLFEGSNDNITWTTLETKTASAPAINTYYTSPILGNVTAYKYYRIYVSATVSATWEAVIANIRLFASNNASVIVATNGGVFNLNGGIAVTVTDPSVGVIGGTAQCINYSSNLTSSITGIISQGTGHGIVITGTGTLNIIGNIITNAGNGFGCIAVSSNATINILGNVIGGTGSGVRGILCTANSPTINITGDVYNSGAGNANYAIVVSGGTPSFYITGNIYIVATSNSYTIWFSTATYLNHVGNISVANGIIPIQSTGLGSTHILSGPFISSNYGLLPTALMTRVFLMPSLNPYYQFRDNSTNGANSPGPVAPTYTLYPPTTIADAPIPANVRSGVVYALGSQTGTLVVPAPGSVASGVVYDNGTLGTAVLTASAVWDALTSTMVTPGSIGERLKNSSTVATTGAQLAAFT